MPFQRHNVCMTGFARHLLPADWRLLTARERVCVGKRWVAVEKCSGGVGAGGQAWLWFCEITETTPWVRRHMTRWPITYSWWGQTERKVTAGHFFLIFLHSGMSRLLLLLHGHTAFPGCTPASVCVSVYALAEGVRPWCAALSFRERSHRQPPQEALAPPPWNDDPPPPVLWSHSAGQGNRAVWEEVEREQQRGIRARSRSDQKKWKQGIINWERGQWEFYTKIRFTLEQTSGQLVRARYLRKKQTILLYKWFIQLNLNMKWFSWMQTGIFILNDGNPDRLDWKDVLHHWLK